MKCYLSTTLELGKPSSLWQPEGLFGSCKRPLSEFWRTGLIVFAQAQALRMQPLVVQGQLPQDGMDSMSGPTLGHGGKGVPVLKQIMQQVATAHSWVTSSRDH